MGNRGRIEFAHKLLRARDWQGRPEIDQLRAWWRTRGHGGAGVFALVGIGGAGKTAIADRFLREVPGVFPPHPDVAADPSLPTPDKLFVFSFYEAPNPQVFLAQILDWLDDREPDDKRQRPRYPEIKARLAKEHGLLLVLDGLEKIQDDGARGGRLGHITDASLRQLLLDLGEGYLPGVSAIVTTRFPLDDLEVAEGPYYVAIDVERIALPACVELLRQRGVHGPDTALEAIAEHCGRHALTVDLVGGYLAAFKRGEPSLEGLPSHDEIARIAADEPNRKRQAVARQSARFGRVAQRYREGLAEHDPAALALMERICLFRSGVTAETLAGIFLGDSKEQVSGPALSQLTPAELKARLHRLSEMRLIEYVDDATGQRRVQVHPAVREGLLAGLATDAATAGHGAVREHLASALTAADVALGHAPDSTPTDPSTQDLLEEVIHHSLEAGLVKEAYSIFESRLVPLVIMGGHDRIERIHRLFAKGHPPATARPGEGVGELFFFAWGLAYQAMGQPALARICLERAESETSRSPGDLGPYFFFAFSLFIEGRLGHALHVFKRELEQLNLGTASFSNIEHYAVIIIDLAKTFLEGKQLDSSFRALLHARAGLDSGDKFTFALLARGDLLVRMLLRAGFLDNVEAIATDFFDDVLDDEEAHEVLREALPLAQLAAAQVSLAKDDMEDALKRIVLTEQWVAAHGSPDIECLAALVRGQLHFRLSDPARLVTSTTFRAEQLDLALKTTDGIRIARRSGYGFYHLELLILRSRIHLWRGEADEAARDARAALYGLDVAPPGKSRFDAPPLDGRSPPDGRGIFGEGRPPLYAATHPECNYVWGEADARFLLGEALALTAAANDDAAMAREATAELDKARALQQRIGDPHLADTEAALARIASGMPPPFPLPPPKPRVVPAIPQKSAPLVFICYAHADNEAPDRWLGRLLQMIEPLHRRGVVHVWTDRAIAIGEQWDAEIQRSLATARAAVLLVSPAFLASTYIDNSELPVLLRRAQQQHSLRILPVLLRPSLFDKLTFRYPDPAHGPQEIKLADFQVAHPAERTLSEMTRPEQDRVLLGVAEALLQLAAD